MLRMRAHGTHLCVTRNFQALARHSNQLPFRANADVGSQFVGAHSKRAGLGQGRKVDHFGGVLFAERHELRRGVELRCVAITVFADHLKQRSSRYQFPFRARFVGVVKKHGGRASNARQFP